MLRILSTSRIHNTVWKFCEVSHPPPAFGGNLRCASETGLKAFHLLIHFQADFDVDPHSFLKKKGLPPKWNYYNSHSICHQEMHRSKTRFVCISLPNCGSELIYFLFFCFTENSFFSKQTIWRRPYCRAAQQSSVDTVFSFLKNGSHGRIPRETPKPMQWMF